MLAVALALVVAALGVLLALAWTSLGKAPSGERLARLRASPSFRDGRFASPVPVRGTSLSDLAQMARDYRGDQQRVPAAAPPFERRRRTDYDAPPASGLRLTWLGHSSALVELDGARILVDPVLADDPLSPLSFVGPRRFFPSPLALAEVPPLDAVVISHDHYDHLDRATVLALASRTRRFVTPLGVGSHLAYWGIPPDQIVELDWGEELLSGWLRIVALPARHFSGRVLLGDRTQWASFAFLGPRHRVFYSGDTGFMPQFAEVGARHGPFDLTLVKIGAYGRGWPDVHLDPEQAVEVHELVRGGWLVPVHWGTLNLSYHGWTEPAERVIVAARARGVALVVPRPGELLEPGAPPAAPPPVPRWWPEVPWERAPAAAPSPR